MRRLPVVIAALVCPLLASAAPHPGQRGRLTDEQEALARSAWQYFENNYQPTTCLYNSVDGYPSTTMWDVASSIAGLTSAYELGIIEKSVLDERLGCMLKTLSRLEMYRSGLPNKVYHTVSLQKVDYGNNPAELGVSAIDLGRLLTWLAIVKERYPTHAAAVDTFVGRWSFCDVVTPEGVLYGAENDGETGVKWLQEGRLGYEEYAAYGYQLWGFDTTEASRAEPAEEVDIFGVPVAYDGRDPAKFGAHNYVLTEAWLLAGLEHGWAPHGQRAKPGKWKPDAQIEELAQRVYEVQERRFEETGILTARTEHQVEEAPYFVYDTVYSDGVPWATIADTGVPYPDLAAVSTKAAIGMSILFDTKYTDRLAEAVMPMHDPKRGLYEGFYESDGRRIESLTANTNGIVLETLLFKKRGALYRGDKPEPQGARSCAGSKLVDESGAAGHHPPGRPIWDEAGG